MKRILVGAVAAAALAGAAYAEIRNLSGFSEINVRDRIVVEAAVGERYSVDVAGPEADRVRTRVENGVLRISDGRRPWFGRSNRIDARVRITAPRLEGVAASRGAEITATLSGECDDFSVAAAMGGAARVSGAACDTVDAAAAMGGVVRIAGTCRVFDVSAAMGGEVRADELECRVVDASAAMGGSIRAFASQSYDASAAMGGAINVAGGASVSDTSAAMGGSITRSER